MNDSRIVLRDLAIALGVLVLVIAGLFAILALGRPRPQYSRDFVDPLVPAAREAPAMAEEPAEAPEAEADAEEPQIRRYVTGTHVVEQGESFSLITGKYWEDIFLWPDLYVRNDMITDDPDLIYPDEIIDIYNRLGRGDVYTTAEKDMILDAYIEVYDIYKALGPDKNASAWTLLWCGAKYDHEFLDIYADRIDPADMAVARRYIAEEGYLD